MHSPRHWAEVGANARDAVSQGNVKSQVKDTTKKHEIWQDKAGQFIRRFSRTGTEAAAPGDCEDSQDEPKQLSRRSSSYLRRDSGLEALDMRDGVIDFRDDHGCYDHEEDHVQTKKHHLHTYLGAGRTKKAG